LARSGERRETPTPVEVERADAGAAADAGAVSCPQTERAIREALESLLGKIHDFENAERPEQALDEIEPARALANELGCYSAAAASAARDRVESWAVRLADWVAIEQKCRASSACMGKRIQTELCAMVYDEREILDTLASANGSRAGSAGAPLPERGLRERLQNLRARQSAAKSRFRSIARRPFEPRACPAVIHEL
jgi:hypothetical protein